MNTLAYGFFGSIISLFACDTIDKMRSRDSLVIQCCELAGKITGHTFNIGSYIHGNMNQRKGNAAINFILRDCDIYTRFSIEASARRVNLNWQIHDMKIKLIP